MPFQTTKCYQRWKSDKKYFGSGSAWNPLPRINAILLSAQIIVTFLLSATAEIIQGFPNVDAPIFLAVTVF